MKTSELRNKTEIELKELVTKIKKDLKDVRLDVMQGKEKNIKKALNTRKLLARIITISKEKQILSEVK